MSMKTNFDQQKTQVEKAVDSCIAAVEVTHPEQRYDAMADYVEGLRALSPVSNDPMVAPLVYQLRQLFIYPTRQEHNKFIIELHDLKELLHEQRLHDVLTRKQAEKQALKYYSLGGATKSSRGWLLLALVSLFVLLRK